MLALGGFCASLILHTMTDLLFKLLINFSFAVKIYNSVFSHGVKCMFVRGEVHVTACALGQKKRRP